MNSHQETLILNLTREIRALKDQLSSELQFKAAGKANADFLTSTQALEVLGLYDPAKNRKPNQRYLCYLAKRGLLPRIKLGSRTIKYKLEDCESLLERCITQGLNLTAKP